MVLGLAREWTGAAVRAQRLQAQRLRARGALSSDPPTMSPSRTLTLRSHRAARSSSWVTTTSVIPRSRCRPNSRSSTISPVFVSRLPVGSSAKITLGSPTSARAMTTRCFCPPDRSFASLLALSASPRASSAAMPRRFRSAPETPAIFSGSTTLSSTEVFGVRKNCWNTKPNVLFRVRLTWRALSDAASAPSSSTSPVEGRSSSASRCMSVDLPDPDLPTIARLSPWCTARDTPFSASNRVEPRP